jgi:tight adherence protein C
MLNLLNILAVLLTFGATFLLVLAVSRFQRERRDRTRLRNVFLPVSRDVDRSVDLKSINPERRLSAVMNSLSRLSVPEAQGQDSISNTKFIRAGLRSQKAVRNFYAVTTVLTILLPIFICFLVSIVTPGIEYKFLLLIGFLCAVSGYYGPKLYLRKRTERRVSEVRGALPDLIDLLVICSKAGLAFDQSLSRITGEISRSSKVIAGEFHIVSLEIRAGVKRSTALRNITSRVDFEELQSFVSMLVQADKFGTSISEAMIIQADLLRVKRMQRAQEIAAKIPTKMLIPLVFLIFPALMIVLMGPAILQLQSVLGQ